MAQLTYVIGPAAGWTNPSAAEVKAGQIAGGGAATADGSEAAPSTDQTFTFASPATGLTNGTAYKIAFVWSDGTDDSNVAVSGDFTAGTRSLPVAHNQSPAARLAALSFY